jgi:hypothetical protein
MDEMRWKFQVNLIAHSLKQISNALARQAIRQEICRRRTLGAKNAGLGPGDSGVDAVGVL